MHLKQLARDGLLKPLQAVSGIVERRHTLPILSNVLVEQSGGKLSVTATDLEIQISAQSDVDVPEGDPHAITLPARKLQDLLRALPDDSVLNIDAQASKVIVKAGRSRFNLQSMRQPTTPVSRQSGQATDGPGAATAIAGVAGTRVVCNGAAGHPVLPQRSAAGLDKNSMLLRHDGHRLSYASLALETEYAHQEVNPPRKTVLELSKLLADDDALVTIDILTNQIRFRFGNIELVSKVSDGTFPINRAFRQGIRGTSRSSAH